MREAAAQRLFQERLQHLSVLVRMSESHQFHYERDDLDARFPGFLDSVLKAAENMDLPALEDESETVSA